MKEIIERLYKDTKESYCLKLKNINFKNKKKFIITLNPESIVMSKDNKEIKDMLLDKNSELVVDSIEIVKVSKLFNINLKQRIPGIEIAQFLLEEANNKIKELENQNE